MRLNTQAIFEGPNPFSQAPVLVVDVQATADEWQGIGTGLNRFCQRWAALGVKPAVESSAIDPGVVEASAFEPLDIARGLAQTALGLLNAVRGCLNDAGAQSSGDAVIRLWLGYHVAPLARQALSLVVEAALVWTRAQPDDAALTQVNRKLQALLSQTRQQHPDYQIRYLMLAARARSVPVLPLVQPARIWQAGWGTRQRLFFESTPDENSLIGAFLADDKVKAKQFLAALGAPIAPHVLLLDRAQLADAVQTIGLPCAVKPLHLNGGKGVTADVQTMAALEAAYDYARQCSAGPIMVERHVHGDEHRLLLFNGRLAWAIRRMAASVVGDGLRSVRALIDELNARRRREQAGNQGLEPVNEDEVFRRHLLSQGVTLDSVPALGQRITMRSVSNLSMGGEHVFVTDRVHPSLRAMVESISAASGLSTIGLDYITTDISADWRSGSGAFIEFNVTPGLDGVELHPSGDHIRLLGELLLGEQVGRIPVLCIVMTAADWRECQPQLQAWMQARGPEFGGSGPGWVWANGAQWQADGSRAQQAAQTMLHHKTVARAVVVTVVEEVVQWGLPLDGVEQLVVVNAALPSGWHAVTQRTAQETLQVDGLPALQPYLSAWAVRTAIGADVKA